MNLVLTATHMDGTLSRVIMCARHEPVACAPQTCTWSEEMETVKRNKGNVDREGRCGSNRDRYFPAGGEGLIRSAGGEAGAILDREGRCGANTEVFPWGRRGADEEHGWRSRSNSGQGEEVWIIPAPSQDSWSVANHRPRTAWGRLTSLNTPTRCLSCRTPCKPVCTKPAGNNNHQLLMKNRRKRRRGNTLLSQRLLHKMTNSWKHFVEGVRRSVFIFVETRK